MARGGIKEDGVDVDGSIHLDRNYFLTGRVRSSV